MNRIYQGRVTRVETLARKDGNGKLQEVPDSQSAPWQKESFQNAINPQFEEQL